MLTAVGRDLNTSAGVHVREDGGLSSERQFFSLPFSYLNGSRRRVLSAYTVHLSEISATGNSDFFRAVFWPREMKEKMPRISQNVKLHERKMENIKYVLC